MLILFLFAIFLTFYGKIKASNMNYKIRKDSFEGRKPNGTVGRYSFEDSETMRRKRKSAESFGHLGNASAIASVVLFIALMGTGGFDMPKASELNFTTKFIFSFFLTLFVNPLYLLAIIAGLISFLIGRDRMKKGKSNGNNIKWMGINLLIGIVALTLYSAYNIAKIT